MDQQNLKPVLSVKDIVRTFGVVTALDHVSMDFYSGCVYGLAGENGSGKSTLSSIIAGSKKMDSGSMLYHGQPYTPSSMIDAQRQGIGMILQELGIIAGVSIAQNIFVGKEKEFRHHFAISKKEMCKKASEALSKVEMDQLDPSLPIEVLDMQEQKLAEVAKVLYADPQILIIDETTTALSQKGKEILYRVIREMKADGKTIIMISHDLQELMNYCDVLTILRDGQLVTTVQTSETDIRQIRQWMVGRKLADNFYRTDYGRKISDEIVLEVNDISTGHGMLEHFSMTLRKGELVGVGGLSHCGIHELGKGIFGAAPLIAGDVIHAPTKTRISDPVHAIRCGIGYVSKDRDRESLIMDANIRENIAAAATDQLKGAAGMIPSRREKSYVKEIVNQLSIKCSSIRQGVKTLSGGNKQKVAFGKWIGRNTDILILDCPTRGVDIGVKAAMYQLMDNMLQQGKSIIMISEELTELIGMSDRIVILRNGRISAWFDRDPGLTENTIIESMI